MKDLISPVMEATSLGNAPDSDIDKMLHDFVKPAFIRMSADKRQKAIDVLKQMAEEG